MIPSVEITKDIEVKIDDWDLTITANKTSFHLCNYQGDGKPYIDAEHIPKLCEILMTLHSEVVQGLVGNLDNARAGEPRSTDG